MLLLEKIETAWALSARSYNLSGKVPREFSGTPRELPSDLADILRRSLQGLTYSSCFLQKAVVMSRC